MQFERCENREMLATLPGYSASFDDLTQFGEPAEYVTLPNANPLNGAREFTLEAWIRRDEVGLVTAAGDAVVTSGDQSEFWFGIYQDHIFLRTGLNAPSVTGNSLLDNHAWTHIAATWSLAEGVKLYVNGQLDGATPASGIVPQWNNKWHLGAAPVNQFEVHDPFDGNISEVRLWDTVRSGGAILRAMHQVIEEPQSGLVAAFPLETSFRDTVSGAAGTPSGDIQFSNLQPSPARHRIAKIDENYGQLSQPLYAAATVYLPQANQAILIGGRDGGQPSSAIRRIDVGTGQISVLGNLPESLAFASAVYVPAIERIYVMGGSSSGVASRNSTYIVDPRTGAVSQGPTLPLAVQDATAVYHPGLQKIFLLGGYPQSTATPTNRVQVIDPTTASAQFANFTLPTPIAGSAAIVPSTTGDLYYFGGARLSLSGQIGLPTQAFSNQTYRIRFTGNNVELRAIPTAQLPYIDMGQSAFEDPRTRMVYLVGGLYHDRMLAFDPTSEKLWETAVQITEPSVTGIALRHAAVVFSPFDAHALVIGGLRALLPGLGSTAIRRLPLGVGPAIALERWDIGQSENGVAVTGGDIAGSDTIVAVSSRDDGVTRLVAAPNNSVITTRFTNAQLGGVPGEPAVDGERQLIAVPIGDGTGNNFRGARLIQGDTITTIDVNTPGFGTNTVFSTYIAPDGTIFFGTGLGLRWKPPGNSANIVATPSRCQDFLTSRGRPNEIWGRAILGSGEFRTYGLCRVLYDSTGILREEFFSWDRASWIIDLKFDKDGNFWVADYERGIWFIPAGETPDFQRAHRLDSVLGTPFDLGVDAEGRVWLGQLANAPAGGGLSVFQASGPVSVRTEDRNWFNAPIGSSNVVRQFVDGSLRPVDLFDSGVVATDGVGERTWMVTSTGQTMSIAQRWQQLDETNRLDERIVDRVWAAAGRIFLATRNQAGSDPMLNVLQPDGLTWDNRTGVEVHSLLQDSQGRVWVGTSNGVRLYGAAGDWDLLADRLGRHPVGVIRGIAEDNIGRIWITSDSGLTLFDRNRFVTTLTSQNSQLPNTIVRRLYTDSQGQIWIATDDGVVVMNGLNMRRLTVANGLPSNLVYDIVESGLGEIFISTRAGLTKYQNGTFVQQILPGGLSTADRPLAVDELGRVWAGAAVLESSGWRNYQALNSGLRSAVVTDIATDGADHIWFAHGTAGGVSVRGTYLPPLADAVPIIGEIDPPVGSSGDYITIRGGGFGTGGGGLRVTIGGEAVEIDLPSVRDDQLRVKINATTQSGKVVLQRSGRTALSNTDFCARPAFRETNTFAPVGAGIGTEVSIYGTNFDRDAAVTIGGGASRKATFVSPTHVKVFVETDDRSGAISMTNHCLNTATSTTSGFRKINAEISYIDLNQGTAQDDVVQNKATMVQNYLQLDSPLGVGEEFKIDTIREIVTDRNGNVHRFELALGSYGTRPPLLNGFPGPIERATIDNSINIANVYFYDWGPANIRTVLLRNGRLVADAVRVIDVTPAQQLQVLLVPIMRPNATPRQLQDMKDNVDGDLAHLRSRTFPFGTANVVWSDEVVQRDDSFDLDSFPGLYFAAPDLDRVRRRHNSNRFQPDAQIVMGIVQPSLVEAGSAPGFAFGADVSELINTVFLDSLDILCDIGNRALQLGTFGILGSDEGCQIDIPLYVGWMDGGSGDPGDVLAHEIGHQLGLVKPWAENGSLDDNVSHSVNDELPEDMECNGWNGVSFDWNKSYYAQPGVTLPLVDPLGNIEWKPIRTPNPNISNRAKALMSYACATSSANTFFEPVDITQMDSRLIPTIADFFQITTLNILIDNERRAESISPSPSAAGPDVSYSQAEQGEAADVAGLRIHVFGTLDTVSGSGNLVRVESYGDSGPITPSFATGYWLVQLDADGRELARTGVAPLGTGEQNPDGAPPNRVDYIFSATLLQHALTSRIELRQGALLLDTFTAGNAIPVVEMTQPASGASFTTGSVTASWTATDADGDPLQVSVEYSSDGGTNWHPISTAAGSGSLAIPVERLGGSVGQGRFRVVASDGFRSADATSGLFSIADQPPRVVIEASSLDATVLEGAAAYLHGSAFDTEDGELSGESLIWTSNLDGPLGTGRVISTTLLSVGSHTITLRAVDSTAKGADQSFQLTVMGDYDFDGIRDQDEELGSLNPLNAEDAYSDNDEDGLSLRTELALNSNPSQADSDGDGRNDGQEYVELTDIRMSDPPLERDRLSASVREIELSVDLADTTPLPQIDLSVFSRLPADWRLVSDVDWLEATAVNGTTPASTLLRVQAYKLRDGEHVGHLRFHSGSIQESELISVKVTATNQRAYFDYDNNGTINLADCSQVQSTIGASFGSPLYDLALDIDRDGLIESSDVGNCRRAIGAVSLDGDVNLDNQVNSQDIDAMFNAVRTSTIELFYDLNRDSVISSADTAYLVESILHTKFGDANLDGVVNELDGNIVVSYLFQSPTGWSRGDFTGDQSTDVSDFNMWNEQKQTSAIVRHSLDFNALPGPDRRFGTADDIPFTMADISGRTIDQEYEQIGVRFSSGPTLGLIGGGFLPDGSSSAGDNQVLQSVNASFQLRPMTIDFSIPQTEITLDILAYINQTGTAVPVTLWRNGSIVGQRLLTNADAIFGGTIPSQLGGRFRLASSEPFDEVAIGLSQPAGGGYGIDNLSFTGYSSFSNAAAVVNGQSPRRGQPRAAATPITVANIDREYDRQASLPIRDHFASMLKRRGRKTNAPEVETDYVFAEFSRELETAR